MAQLPFYTKVQVVCISNDDMPSILTVGKIYEAIDMEIQTHVIQTKDYNLISDDGFRDSHKKDLFITLAEFRQHRIDEILED